MKQIVHVHPESRIPLANESAQAYSFDLVTQVGDCVDACWENQNGLLGFLLDYNSHDLLKNLCEQLRYKLGRSTTSAVTSVLSIDHKIRSVSDVVIEVKARLPKLREKDLLIPIKIDEIETVAQFWKQLQQACGTTFAHRLIVVIGSPRGSECSLKGLHKLESPRFKRRDILSWISPVVSTLDWPDAARVISGWKDMMFRECSRDNHLDIDRVYRHLNFVSELLQENPAAEVFLEQLHMRCESYAQTTY